MEIGFGNVGRRICGWASVVNASLVACCVNWGLDVLTCNYRTNRGEIDLVARDGATLCFVEVKTRHHRVNSRPADAVGTAKRERITRAARQYLRELGFPSLAYRYDIVEVVLVGRRVADIRYWRNAFQEGRDDASFRFPRR